MGIFLCIRKPKSRGQKHRTKAHTCNRKRICSTLITAFQSPVGSQSVNQSVIRCLYFDFPAERECTPEHLRAQCRIPVSSIRCLHWPRKASVLPLPRILKLGTAAFPTDSLDLFTSPASLLTEICSALRSAYPAGGWPTYYKAMLTEPRGLSLRTHSRS